MKHLIILLLLIGCASNEIDSLYSARGYKQKEKDLIDPYAKKYYKMLAAYSGMGMYTTSMVNTDARTQVQKVFCYCLRKLGNKCQTKPKKLKGRDLTIWAKGNAAEVTLKASGNGMIADKDMCP